MSKIGPALVIVVAVVAAYANAFQGTFQFDDYNVIVHNPVVHSWAGYVADLGHGIRPLLKLTYTWNWVSGQGLFGFHLVNVLLHAANAVLLLWLAGRLLPEISGVTSLLAALLFAVHPVQTEAVTYICGRSVSLMAFCALVSLQLYCVGQDRGNVFLTSVLSPLFFLLAVLSKEVAATLPLVLLLCHYVRASRRPPKVPFLIAQGVHWAIVMALLGLGLSHPGYRRLFTSCFDIRGIGDNALTQVSGIYYLLGHLVMPWALNIDPDLAVLSSVTWPLAVVAGLLAGLLIVGGWSLAQRRLLGFGIFWFVLHLLPTNSIVPRLDVANDRQLYLAAWGVFLPVAAGVDLCRARMSRPWLAALACGLGLLVLTALTASRNSLYRSEISLWQDTVKKSPAKARAQNNLGYAYELAHRRDEAAAAYRKALALDRHYAPAQVNLARVGKGQGE